MELWTLQGLDSFGDLCQQEIEQLDGSPKKLRPTCLLQMKSLNPQILRLASRATDAASAFAKTRLCLQRTMSNDETTRCSYVCP
jgi:hypothetical protein